MYGFLASVCIIFGLAGALPLIPLAIFFAWMEHRKDVAALVRQRARAYPAQAPPVCIVCGSHKFYASNRKFMMPAQGIRSMQFPMTGAALVRTFTCADCGYAGRYGFASDAPERGWIALTPYMRGW